MPAQTQNQAQPIRPPDDLQSVADVELRRFAVAEGVDVTADGWWLAVEDQALNELAHGLYHEPGDPAKPSTVDGVTRREAMAHLALGDLFPVGIPRGLFLNVSKKTPDRVLSICPSDTRPAAKWIGESDADTYICLTLLSERLPRYMRVSEDRAGALIGISLDLDAQAPYRKRFDLFKSLDQAWEAISLLPTPRLVIGTGAGLQPVWVFREPLPLETEAARDEAKAKVVRFQDTIRRIVHSKFNVTIDKTSDLARLVRAPGSLNFKTNPPVPTSVSLSLGEYLDV